MLFHIGEIGGEEKRGPKQQQPPQKTIWNDESNDQWDGKIKTYEGTN